MKSSQSGLAKLLIIVVIAAIVILGAGGAAAWLLFNKNLSRTLKEAAPVVANPLFIKLDPFTVNVQGGPDGDRILYVGVTLELGNKTTLEFINEYMPQVRNRLLMVLSDQNAAALTTSEGKKQLAALVREALTKPFTGVQPKLEVDHVLFTQFIVQ